MIITRTDGIGLRLQHGDVTIAVNPPSKDSSRFKTSKFGADIVLVSAGHPDVNGIESVTFGDKVPFEISGPGEYEYKEIFFRGVGTGSKYDAASLKGSSTGIRHNTAYTFTVDGINVCVLGLMSDKALPPEAEEGFGDIDILFITVDTKGETLAPLDANALAVALEPKIIIPTALDTKGEELFLKEAGAKNPEKTEKLTIKKKDLQDKEGEIILVTI